MRKAPATRGGASPRATLRAGPENKRQAAAVRFPGAGEQSDGGGKKAFGEPDAQPGEVRNLLGGQPGRGEGGKAEKHVSPAGDGCERGGALHGVANEAEVLENFRGGAQRRARSLLGGTLRAREAPDAMRSRLEHEDRVAALAAIVKYFAMQR